MKNKLLLFIMVVFVGISFIACTTFQASGLQMGGMGNQQYEVKGDFSKKVWVPKFLGTCAGPTLFNISAGISEGFLQRAVMSEIQELGGDAAINIKIKWGSNPIQAILNFITFNIVAPTTLTVSGTVIKYK